VLATWPVSGPVCPEQAIVVRDGKVELEPASANDLSATGRDAPVLQGRPAR
jgi:hypothetical protein